MGQIDKEQYRLQRYSQWNLLKASFMFFEIVGALVEMQALLMYRKWAEENDHCLQQRECKKY